MFGTHYVPHLEAPQNLTASKLCNILEVGTQLGQISAMFIQRNLTSI